MAIRKYLIGEAGKKLIRYQAQLWKSGNILKSKSFSRKIDAQNWLAAERLFLINPNLRPEVKEVESIVNFFDDKFINHKRCSEGTRLDYRSLFNLYVRPYFPNHSAEEIGSHDWTQHLTGLVNRREVGPARANRLRTMLSSLYSYGIKKSLLKENPIPGVEEFEERQTIRKTWTTEEAKKFFFQSNDSNSQYVTFFQLAYETGMRMGEIQALQRDAVSYDSSSLSVARSYSKHAKKIVENTKGRKTRTISASQDVLQKLKDLGQSHSYGLFFCQKDGSPLTQDQIRWAFHSACEAANVPKICFHSLRHNFATHFLLYGGGTLELKKILGHSRVETTERYTHLPDSHVASQISRLHLRRIK